MFPDDFRRLRKLAPEGSRLVVLPDHGGDRTLFYGRRGPLAHHAYQRGRLLTILVVSPNGDIVDQKTAPQANLCELIPRGPAAPEACDYALSLKALEAGLPLNFARFDDIPRDPRAEPGYYGAILQTPTAPAKAGSANKTSREGQ